MAIIKVIYLYPGREEVSYKCQHIQLPDLNLTGKQFLTGQKVFAILQSVHPEGVRGILHPKFCPDLAADLLRQ